MGSVSLRNQKSAFCCLRNITRLRVLMSIDDLEKSHADWTTASDCSQVRLRQQRAAARVVTNMLHTTLFLRSLHWLPVSHRINFKLLMLVHESYLSDLLNLFGPLLREYLLIPMSTLKLVKLPSASMPLKGGTNCQKSHYKRQ